MSIDLNGDDDVSARHSLEESPPDSDELLGDEEAAAAAAEDEPGIVGTDVSHYAPRMSSDIPATSSMGRSGSLADLAPRLESSSTKRTTPSRPAVAMASIRGSKPQVDFPHFTQSCQWP